jgi:hypothetical protein
LKTPIDVLGVSGAVNRPLRSNKRFWNTKWQN